MPTVLVVDDTPEVRNAVRRILARAGYDVICAEGGAEALAITAERDLHAAVVDYNMPGMDGLTLLVRLGEVQPAMVRVLVSGELDVDVVMAAVNRGDISGVLHKPFDPHALAALLRRGIRRRAASSQSWYANQDSESQRVQQELRALCAEGLTLALQPIVDGGSRHALAFEGLLRSSSSILPTAGHLIAAAEKYHAIAEITRVVVRQAAGWLDELPEHTSLFLNLHPSELESPEVLLESLAPLGPRAPRIVLEITERKALAIEGDWRKTIAELRARGFRIAIDDLGAGASSLAALAHVDPDVVKIDMSLVRGIDADERKQRLVEVLCRFAHASNVQIVAEGIETEAEAETCARLGAGLLQGYIFGKAESLRPTVLRNASAPSLPPPPPRSNSATRRRAAAVSHAEDPSPAKRSGSNE
jgi:EAL domain-containing protein (putative c-di-GMP-specific phosphodiesterase class I)